MQQTTPRASTSGPEIPFEYTQPSKDKAAKHAEATIPKEPPATIAGRRNLRNFESRPPPTDFETWKQSEAALQAGISTKQMVQREFERNFGPDCVQCAPHWLFTRPCLFGSALVRSGTSIALYSFGVVFSAVHIAHCA